MTKTTKPDPTGVDDPTDPAQLPADRPGLKPHPDHELPEQPEKPGRPEKPGKPDQGLPGEGKPGEGRPEAKTKTGAAATPAIIFADGPHQGAESLPEGAVEGPGNELHVPHETGLLVYMRADPTATPASDVPAYRLFRTEPQYRTATAPPVLEPPAGSVLADRDATDAEKDAKDTAERNPKSRDVKA